MNLFDQAQCESMWQAATNAELGVLIRTDNPMKCKAMLYEFRTGNPNLAGFQIRFSPKNPDTELWIIKNRNENYQPPTQEPEL